MNKITASEARKLAIPEKDIALEQAYNAIREAASKQLREVRLHSPFWVDGGYRGTKEYQEAVSALKDDGFDVKFFYEERQFVNMFTIVSW